MKPKLRANNALYQTWTDFNPKQQEFVFSKTKNIMASGGKGGGKTVALVRRTILLLIDSPIFGDMSGNVGCIGRLREKDFIRTTLPELKKWLPPPWIKSEQKNIGRLELINGSVLWYAHFDNISSVVSLNLGFIAADQAEEMPEEVWDELSYNRIRLKTMTRYRRDGTLIVPQFDAKGNCISTDPLEQAAVLNYQTAFGACNPRRCWIYNRFVRNEEYRISSDLKVQEKYNPKYQLINIPTTENIRNVPQDYISDQKKDKTDKAYNRDVLGTWDAWEGQIYIDFTDDLIRTDDTDDKPANIIPHPSWKIYIGIDHGGTGLDPSKATGVTAVVFVAIETIPGSFPKAHVFDELYLPSSTIKETVEAIDNKLQHIYTQQKYHYPEIITSAVPGRRVDVQKWRCDPSMQKNIQDSNETIIQRYKRFAKLRGMKMPLAPGGNDFSETSERVSWIMREKIMDVSPKCIDFIEDHKDWEYGNNEKPRLMQKDHAADAFRYIASAFPFAMKKLSLPALPKSIVDVVLEQQEQDRMANSYDEVYGDFANV